jgi:cobyrinic acid a,c-diamide synthase
MKIPRFLIASPSSHCGKTTITLSLIRALAKRDYAVQPFKCGPDYLDTYLHTIAASSSEFKNHGINLDTFMASKSHVMSLFHHYSAKADAIVVEGVMGLFDGAQKSQGSSAEIAMLLNLPVILVVNAGQAAYSVAPLIYGFKNFEPDLNLVGAIFNNVNTESHYQFLKEACEDIGVEALGYVPHNEAIEIKERHLGLNISTEYDQDGIIEHMAEHVTKTVDLDRLLELCKGEIEQEISIQNNQGKTREAKIAVARDEAFNFIYEPNLDALRKYGDLVFFSPLTDTTLPEADCLYISGGYPELYIDQLSQNEAMREQIKSFCQGGGLCYAECGGMMYLGNAIIDHEGKRSPMCGALDCETTMQNAKLSLGYRKISLKDDHFNHELRGHEFHYSQLIGAEKLENIATVKNARDMDMATGLYRSKNTFVSYIHQYWGEEPAFIEYMFQQTCEMQK